MTTARLLAAALGLAALLLAAQFNPYLADYGDDAEFLILGQSLALGQGYTWVNGVERPAHNRYPPGYPALLAGALTLSGTRDDAFAAITPAKLVTAATFALSVALLWPIARRRLPAPWAAAAVALFALNPFVIRFAVQVMSDVPFILLELAALVWADRLVRPTAVAEGGGRTNPALGNVWGWALLGALLALGAYVRTVGDVAAAGVVAWVWVRAGRRPALIAAASFAALMLPWWLRDAGLAGGWRYWEEFVAAQYENPAEGAAGPGQILARAVDNALFVLGKPGAFGPAGFAAAALGAALVGIGYWRSVRRANGAAEWIAVPLVLAVLIWPIKTGRYLLPVVPLVCIYAVGGVYAVSSWWQTRARHVEGGPEMTVGRPYRARIPSLVAAVGLVAAALFEAGFGLRESASNVRSMAAAGSGTNPAGYYRQRPEWSHFIAAADWLRANAGPADVAMSRRHFALYVYSGRTTDKYRFDVGEEEVAYLTAGTARKFVVEDAFDYLRGEFAPLPAALRARGGDLLLRFETAAPAVRVWELVRPTDGCCRARS